MGSGHRLATRLSVHGHLTVNGEKMSKSRGTFISAEQYARHLDPQWLRYYFATRLGPSPADLDLNFTDFAARVNSELVGKIANLMSRVAPMLSRLLEGQTGVITQDALGLLDAFRRAQDEMVDAYEGRHFAAVTRTACALADKANKFVEDNAPW
jgi:methionyl-tRNA synthetase